jgi:hypothetical protein
MNAEDKKRFARYRHGYVEPPEPILELENPSALKEIEKSKAREKEIAKNKEKVKDTLGFVEEIKVSPNDLISQIISEMEKKEAHTGI